MNEEKLEKIYRIARVLIFTIPVLVVIVGLFLVLFPVDSYNFYPDDPKLSKFEIQKDADANKLSFGVFPLRNYRFIKLALNFRENDLQNCQVSEVEVTLEKTYRAFLLPMAETIDSEEKLHDFLFDGNQTEYPNGTLAHLKPTNQVFFISHGKKILFPGPEIFQAFGYSFDNLIDVDQSEIDKYPDADTKEFLWTMPHPDGTIFQTFPSHTLFLVFDGKKYPIASKELLEKVWPKNYSISVSDSDSASRLKCENTVKQNQLSCQFDTFQLSSVGRYYQFWVEFPSNCPIENVNPDNSQIRFFSEKSAATVKESIRNIASSILNRYFYKSVQSQ